MATYTIDFETYPILPKPNYPPWPFALALKEENLNPVYFAWDHFDPEENNIDFSKIKTIIKDLFSNTGNCFIAHNAAFELAILEEYFDVEIEDVNISDTMVMAFLDNPYSKSLVLKILGWSLLRIPADSQMELENWILANVFIKGEKVITKPWKGFKKVAKSEVGKYIFMAPRRLVEPYTLQDVHLAKRLYDTLFPKLRDCGMLGALHREMMLIPEKIKMEERGVRLDKEKIEEASQIFEDARDLLEEQIKKKIGMPGEGNLNSRTQLPNYLEKAGFVKPENWIKTPKGAKSVSMDNLVLACHNEDFINQYSMLSVLNYYLSTYLRPWKKLGERAYPKWNLTKGSPSYGDYNIGAATGRTSSSNPNFQNISINPEDSTNRDVLLSLQRYLVEKFGYHFWGLRDYIIPDEEKVFIGRDFSQQELRILAYFEDGELSTQYLNNPKLDVHEMILKITNEREGLSLVRKEVKTTVFCTIYGGGYQAISKILRISYEQAKVIKDAIMDTIPGVRNLNNCLMEKGRHDKPIYTWGDRRYFCQPSSDNRTFEYKMLNYLIQGSAADVTKTTMVKTSQTMPDSQLLATVHDEFLMQTDKEIWKEEMVKLKNCMYMEIGGIKMISDGKFSPISWARMKNVK